MRLKFFLFICSIVFLPVINFAKIIEVKKYIVVVALDSEIVGAGIEKYAPVVYTGVGKVNATIKLFEAINKYKPELVINYGTAGSLKNKTGLFKIDTFVQRDMDVRALGFKRGITPFENDKLSTKIGIVLGTGDSFVTDSKKQLEGLDIDVDLVDMEGFALKKVCDYLNVKFISYKNVSDSADEKAANDWKANALKGAKAFKKVLEENFGKSLLK